MSADVRLDRSLMQRKNIEEFCMSQDPPTVGSRIPWLGIVLVIVVLGIGVQWWIVLPGQSASRFTSRLFRGLFKDAVTMLSDSAAIVPHASGGLTVNGADGSSVTFHRDDLPLMSYIDPGRQSRRGAVDYIQGRYCFQVGAWQNRKNDNRRMTVIDCVAEGRQVVIETVRKY